MCPHKNNRAEIFAILLAFVACMAFADPARELKTEMGIRQQDDATLKWWQDAKFGMFIHWGLYAVPAKGEWHMENAAIPVDTYRQYAFDHGRLTRQTILH